MIKILRKHRNWLMIVIAILALPFCVYFVKSDVSAIRSDEFARMYGRKISSIEAQRDVKLFQLADFLKVSDLTDALAPGTGEFNQRAPSFIINLTVLRHEAERLGIEPAESEVVDAIKKFPGFQGQAGFDPEKYDQVARTVLPSLGFSDEQLRELAHDQLCLKRIKDLVGSAVSLPESESKSNFEQLYGKNFVTVVHVKATDLTKDIKVSDDDVKKYYETHKSELKTESKRKVEFVRLALNDDQKKLKDKERIDALQKLADRANDFSQALLEKGADFKQVAAKFQFPVETTGEFTSSAPDPKLKADAQLSQAAFKLSQQEPNSDPIQVAGGYAVLHLAGIVEAQPLALDEAKTKIVDAIKSDRAREMAMTKGRTAADALRNAVKSGQPFETALQQAGGLKSEKMEPFTVADETDDKKPAEKPTDEPTDRLMIKNVASQLQPGEVSEFIPWIDGGLIVRLEKREPPEPAKYQEAKAKFEERYFKSAREYVFMEWLRDRQRDAGLGFARG
jgi:peptidyl-prolyl cis-trans isomerase D